MSVHAIPLFIYTYVRIAKLFELDSTVLSRPSIFAELSRSRDTVHIHTYIRAHICIIFNVSNFTSSQILIETPSVETKSRAGSSDCVSV